MGSVIGRRRTESRDRKSGRGARRSAAKRKEISMLVLGSSEAGKSTFVKQLRLVHGDGYSERERNALRYVVRSSLYTSIKTLICGVEELGDRLPEERLSDAAAISNLSVLDMADALESQLAMPQEHVSALERLWSEPVVKACFHRRFDLSSMGLHVPEASVYFLDNLARVARDGYTPSIEDVLRVRLPTTGIHEYNFNVGKTPFRIYDVGGQRSERRKWIHRFEGTTAIIFIAAISEYDQMLAEDVRMNRVTESLALFKTVLSYQPLKSCTIVLFLNKTDLFAERLQKSTLSKFFPDYKGPPHDIAQAGTFILNLFGEIGLAMNRVIYAHFTCATDTASMKVVFDAVKDSILQDSLQQANLI